MRRRTTATMVVTTLTLVVVGRLGPPGLAGSSRGGPVQDAVVTDRYNTRTFIGEHAVAGHARKHHVVPDCASGRDAFLVDDTEFDASFARLKKAGVRYFADHDKSGPGEINHHWGGRGVYFEDPNGHLLELITKPYGELPV